MVALFARSRSTGDWWRVNAWAEIGAMVSSLVVANGDLFCRVLAAVGLLSPAAMEKVTWFYASDTYGR